jgi:hypothetical protein
MRVFGDGKWKTWLAIVFFACVIGFAVRQYRIAFGSRLPDWMHLQEHTSQPIPGQHEVNSAWFQFAELLKSTRAAAESQHIDHYTIWVTELGNDVHTTTYWSGETIPNQGFDPMPNIERQFYSSPSLVLGYYNSEGTPLDFATRGMPGGGDHVIATVHADTPIAPGASFFLIRREIRTDPKATTSKGERTIGLGNLRYAPGRIETRGVLLPPGATLGPYVPEAPAIVIPSLPTMVAWISSDLITNKTPLSVTFTPH